MKGDKYRLFGLFEKDLHLFGVEEPARLYLMGADSRGRDLFSRILYGGRVSLSIGLVGCAITFILGMMIGGISGYLGGRIDNLIMRICEMVMMIPGFYLMLALRAAFPPELSSWEVYLLIVVILSLIGWAGMARVVRGMALSIREHDFTLAAKAQGASSLWIIYHHILPNLFSYAIISLTLSIPGYILGESALSLLGLGIQDPYASWGNLLAEAMNIAEIRFHPWVLIPGLFIFITVMAFNFLGDGLRDAFDPKTVITA
jgi:peptide/nickel transport system permease protein